MALRFDAVADNLTRSTTLPSITSFTIMGWFMRVGAGGLNGSGQYEAVFGFGSTTSTYAAYIRTNSVAVWAVTEWSADYTGSAVVDNTWYHFAMTCAGTGAGQLLGYLNGVLNITGNAATITGSTLQISADPPPSSEWFNGRVAAIKVYGAVLTANEIAMEMQYFVPIRSANLNTWLPCIEPTVNNNAIDFSGIGGNMTVGGTLTVEDGPPIAWAPVSEDVMGMAYDVAAGFPGVEGVPLFGCRVGFGMISLPVMIPVSI